LPIKRVGFQDNDDRGATGFAARLGSGAHGASRVPRLGRPRRLRNRLLAAPSFNFDHTDTVTVRASPKQNPSVS
jgi:hypothetical protein